MSNIKVKTRLVNIAPYGERPYLEVRHIPYDGEVPFDLGNPICLNAYNRWQVARELVLALVGVILGPILRDLPQQVAAPVTHFRRAKIAKVAEDGPAPVKRRGRPKKVDNPTGDADSLWASVARRQLDGTPIGSWSTPVRHDGPPGTNED
jgi:hypothetical protein